ncbi:hypothetical protein KP806_01795 [Paenibacillus sp. N4]|uniref:hypothetical protein n=1 Tax=Paenibacillus vietnamensis TaxID=2590547 RepID=UPI001CD0EF5D|nr:hypothetical protein [Paenibacillus vietnamensis]MCA0753765.1 hypothetical protein [Paenibacillus vietnamensis]
MSNSWWHEPQRVIQTNLQVRDTERIDPARLAAQIREMGGTTLVFNVGGIYAWYDTQVPYHYKNEFLPEGRDLLSEVIGACHREGLRFVARFDFSKADDSIYQLKPQWFVRDAVGRPQVTGALRPGNWSLLMSTCINTPYRGDAVAIPVIGEVLSRYDIDGIFFNAPQYLACHCSACRRKYKTKYGRPLPDDPSQFESDWASDCQKESFGRIYNFLKEKRPELPIILYYFYHNENMGARAETSDMFCTEAQNVLSKGLKNIPEFWEPAVNMMLGRTLPDRPAPFGIIHSSPGMDWRHAGLPPADYKYWMSQVPAHGGQIWHSLTGIPDTITDKRILSAVTEMNKQIALLEPYMAGARTCSQVALLWKSNPPEEGWANGLLATQTPFDLMLEEEVTAQRLFQYRVLIIPERFVLTERLAACVRQYAEEGGKVLFEGEAPHEQPDLFDLLGIEEETAEGESLVASYIRFEGADNPLQRGLEETEMIPHRGKVTYCTPKPDTQVLATLVPPFSPLESVGSPPERASLPVKCTKLPMCCVSAFGKGLSVYLPFSLSALVSEYRLADHYKLLSNLADLLLGEEKRIRTTRQHGLQIALFRQADHYVINVVNGTGSRPLVEPIPLRNIEIELKLENSERLKAVRTIVSGHPVRYELNGCKLTVTLDEVEVWDSLLVELESSANSR